MAIAASSVLPNNSLEVFRIEFNNLVSDVTGITATNKFTENIIFEGATADAYETTLTVTDPTADRTITLPNTTGTVLIQDELPALLPSSANTYALGSAALEWSDLFLGDGAVANFGNDQDVTLTHVADTGLLLNSTMQLLFNDSSQYISGASATKLDIRATDEIELTSTLVDVVGALTVSGTTTLNGALVLGDAAADTLTVNATLQGASPLTFEGGTADGYETTFAITAPTTDRTITFPNLTGTVSLITATETLTNKTITAGVAVTSFDMNGTELLLDVDADTSITADTDDQIDFKIGGADDFRMTANTFTVLSGSTLTIASGATIDGSSGTLIGFASAADVVALAIALG